MKNSKIYSRLGELSLKYANIGLTIDFEFNRFEMILRGYLDLSLNKYDVYRYNRAYSYEMIKSLSDDIDIETLVDEFKEEVFKQYKLSKKKAESEDEKAMNNKEIREKIAKKRLKHYEVAQAIGITQYTFSHWLQTEMDTEKKSIVLKAIDSIKI